MLRWRDQDSTLPQRVNASREAAGARAVQLRESEAGGARLGKQRRETVRRNAPGGIGRDSWKPGHASATRLPVDRERERSRNGVASGAGPRAFSHRGLNEPASSAKQAFSVSQQNAALAGWGAEAGVRTLAVGGQQSEQQSASGGGSAVTNAIGDPTAGRGHRPLPASANQGRQKASEANARQTR